MRQFGNEGLSFRTVILVCLLVLAGLWWVTMTWLPSLPQV
jgi:hypothetical protein